MNLTDLKKIKVKRKYKFTKGRGRGSGLGGQAGRGHKGQLARSGWIIKPFFEGGQMPLLRRLPKRGFNNIYFRTEYQIVNLASIEEKFNDGETVSFETLKQKGLLKGKNNRVKILAEGNLTKKLTFKVHKFSEESKKKITATGGTIEILKL